MAKAFTESLIFMLKAGEIINTNDKIIPTKTALPASEGPHTTSSVADFLSPRINLPQQEVPRKSEKDEEAGESCLPT